MADFSCYIKINNNTQYTLTLEKKDNNRGNWEIEPPNIINPFSVTHQFQIKDNKGPFGSTGYVIYKADSSNTDLFTINFNDPYIGCNSCSITNPDRDSFSVCFNAKSPEDTLNNECPKSGHPLTMIFYITSFV